MRLFKFLWVGVLIFLVTPAWGQTPGTGEAAKPAPSADPNAAPAADAEAAPSAAPATPEMDGATYSVRVRDLEVGISELKEQIRRSHTRLSLLSDTVFAGGFGGAVARVTLVDRLGGGLTILRAVAVLDGEVQFNKQSAEGVLGTDAPVVAFDGPLPPGSHMLQVMIEVQSTGYGVFSYMDGYKRMVEASHEFVVPEGDKAEIQIIIWEQGGVTTSVLDRPAIKFLGRVVKGSANSLEGAEGVTTP